MRVVIQRVSKASVKVSGDVVGSINSGLMILVGFTEGDNEEKIDYMIKKILNLRIFDDENGIMNLSVLDVEGSILSVSQFTLYADTAKGNRPSYINALKSDESSILYDMFNTKIKEHIKVEMGIFGASMEVSLINDGPITLVLER